MAATIKITINTAQAGTGLKDAQDQVKGLGDATDKAGHHFSAFGSLATGVLQGIGQAAFNAATGGIAAVADGLMGLAKSGLEQNAAMEQTATAFTTLLGSAQESAAFLEDLRKFAAATPFEFPELADASKKLLAMGFAAKDVVPMMTNIGDAVGALGGGKAEIDRVIMALGQMQAKGKVSAEEMNQLAELGIPAWKMLADSMGITIAEAQDLSKKGLLPANEAIAALNQGMHDSFGGAMQAQATTFNGLMSTLADNANLALQSFTGPLFETAKGALGELGTLVSSPAFQQFATDIGGKVGAALGQLATQAAPVISAVMNLAGALMDAGPMSSEFGEALGYLASQLGLNGDAV